MHCTHRRRPIALLFAAVPAELTELRLEDIPKSTGYHGNNGSFAVNVSIFPDLFVA